MISACANNPLTRTPEPVAAVPAMQTPLAQRQATPAFDQRAKQLPIVLVVAPYADKRDTAPSRKIGSLNNTVFDIRGKDLVIEQDVAELVTQAVRKQFAEAGYQVRESGASGGGDFVLSGVVREMRLDVDMRDYILLTVESTLRDSAGRVIWSGVVTEKNDRFAGVSGNTRASIMKYLNSGLTTVAGKTQHEIGNSIRQLRPELFVQEAAIAKVKEGVTVLVAPAAPAPTSAPIAQTVAQPAVQPAQAVAPTVVPVVAQPAAPAAVPPPPQAQPQTSKGMLTVNTTPARARVYIGDVYHGLSPAKIELDAGVHVLGMRLEGYKTVTEKVLVKKGQTTEYELKLAK